jgi:cysteinyl-tRNA synthetase
MKKPLWAPVLLVAALVVSGFDSCGNDGQPPADRDYRQEMRNFVQAISSYAKAVEPDFVVIPQNGHELLTEDGEASGSSATAYVGAIDGVGREDLFYGYTRDNLATPPSERDRMIAFMDLAETSDVEALVYTSFAADSRELDTIPAYPVDPFAVNDEDIRSLALAKNFLYLINPDSFSDKDAFLNAAGETGYDVLIVDLFYDGVALTESEVSSLKSKANGASRLVVAYMSIGEAEDYRYYWQTDWEESPPSWLEEENPNWPGNYKVRYWDPAWQGVIFGDSSSYLDMILYAGLDGVYLDIIDAFEYFEDQ